MTECTLHGCMNGERRYKFWPRVTSWVGSIIRIFYEVKSILLKKVLLNSEDSIRRQNIPSNPSHVGVKVVVLRELTHINLNKLYKLFTEIDISNMKWNTIVRINWICVYFSCLYVCEWFPNAGCSTMKLCDKSDGLKF